MDQNKLLIPDIKPGAIDWTSKVRVVSKSCVKVGVSRWKYQKLILADEQGNTVDGIIFDTDIPLFTHRLRQGETYVVKNAKVEAVRDIYINRLMIVPYVWKFNQRTFVMLAEGEPVYDPNLSPEFINSSQFASQLGTDVKISTVCVIISRRPSSRFTETKEGESCRHEYVAVDSTLVPFVVSIWNDIMDKDIYETMMHKVARPVVALLNFSVKTYYGISLGSSSQSMILTKFHAPFYRDVEKWRDSNQDKIDVLLAAGISFEHYGADHFDSSAPTHSIGSILGLREDATYNVVGRAKLTKECQSFFYMGCKKCHSKTSAEEGESFHCNSPKCGSIQIAEHWLKFLIHVYDATGGMDVTFFGPNAEKLITVKAPELISKFHQDPLFPVRELNDTLEQLVLQLKIRAKKYNEQMFHTVIFVQATTFEAIGYDPGMQTPPEVPIISLSTSVDHSGGNRGNNVKKRLEFEETSNFDDVCETSIDGMNKNKARSVADQGEGDCGLTDHHLESHEGIHGNEQMNLELVGLGVLQQSEKKHRKRRLCLVQSDDELDVPLCENKNSAPHTSSKGGKLVKKYGQPKLVKKAGGATSKIGQQLHAYTDSPISQNSCALASHASLTILDGTTSCIFDEHKSDSDDDQTLATLVSLGKKKENANKQRTNSQIVLQSDDDLGVVTKNSTNVISVRECQTKTSRSGRLLKAKKFD